MDEAKLRKNGRRVFMVDDDEKSLGACQEVLTRRGFSVTTCSDSTQALSLLKTQTPDVALLDIRMPGMEGTDLLPLIKRVQPELPVILVSAYCDDTHAGYYHAMGAFDTISKPFSHEVLLETIARAMDQHEHIPLVLTSLSLHEGRDYVYRKLILASLRRTDWNQVKAAELLGVSRYCLMRWIKRLGISY